MFKGRGTYSPALNGSEKELAQHLTYVELKTIKKHNVRVASSIWGKMGTAAWETAPQIALRNCFRGAEGEVRVYVILV